MKTAHLGILSLFLICTPSYANDATSLVEETVKSINPLDFWKFSPGIGLRSITLDVTRKSDGHTGVLTNDDNVRDGNIGDLLYFSLDIESPAWMFSKHYGVSIRSQTQNIDIFRQEVPPTPPDTFNEAIDLGTSVQGYYTYIGPTLFAVLDERNSLGLTERIGIGIVYWKAKFSGDIILAQNNNASRSMPRTNISDVIDNTIGPIAYYQWLGDRILFEVSLARVRFSNDQFKSELEELNVTVGITF